MGLRNFSLRRIEGNTRTKDVTSISCTLSSLDSIGSSQQQKQERQQQIQTDTALPEYKTNIREDSFSSNVNHNASRNAILTASSLLVGQVSVQNRSHNKVCYPTVLPVVKEGEKDKKEIVSHLHLINCYSRGSSSSSGNTSRTECIQYYKPDVYGQTHPMETPELIEISFIRFEVELQLLPTEQTLYAYEAEIKCPTLVQRDLKITFIRTEVFQTKAAATRYATYWQKRYTLFGEHRAYRPITIANMTPDEIEILSYQLLNTIPNNHPQDQDDDNNTICTIETRSLFYVDFGKFTKNIMACEAFVRVMWYIFHTLMEDVEIQRRGIIFIGNMSGFQLSQFPNQTFLKLLMLYIQECVPVRMSAFHVVNPPMIVKYVFPLFTVFIKERLRKRFAIHPERDTKLIQRLQNKYTIPSLRLPAGIGGTFELNIEQWMMNRRRIEQSM
jgi:CRAL/TRIO domain